MGYPIIKPPVQTSILFGLEKNDHHSHPANDPKLHPLFGIPITDRWPKKTEYQDAFCRAHKPKCPNPCPPRQCVFKQKPLMMHYNTDCKNMPKLTTQRGQALDKLCDPTPLPLIDKHFRGYYYRIDDPIGVITHEEITKCRETVQGPQKIRVQDEMESTYTPNYRYKEWVQQPQIDIIRQLDGSSPVCRLPEPDTQHWDLYNNVRMNRPSPKISDNQFAFCRMITIPLHS